MWNRVIAYSLREIEVFLKVPVMITIRFGENNVLEKIYIDIYIYMNFGDWQGGWEARRKRFIQHFYFIIVGPGGPL